MELCLARSSKDPRRLAAAIADFRAVCSDERMLEAAEEELRQEVESATVVFIAGPIVSRL